MSLTQDEAEAIVDDFRKHIEEKSWDEMLSELGRNVEDIGRMLHGRGRKKPKVWKSKDLEHLRSALKTSSNVLKIHVQRLKEEEEDNA